MSDQLYAPLFDRVASVEALRHAWRKVRANRGAAGVDAVSVLAFEKNLDDNLRELSRNLLNQSYEPLPARAAFIPRPDRQPRELAIPAVRDRVAQRAVLDAIEPLFEPRFLDCSFAFRPGRSVEMAVQKIAVARARGLRWAVRADVLDFFPSIDHKLLVSELSRALDDPGILRLVALWLDAGVLTPGQTPVDGLVPRLKNSAAGSVLAVRAALDGMLDDYVSERIGSTAPTFDDPQFLDEPPIESTQKRSAIRRLVESGVVLALAERAAIGRFLTPAVLGAGGAAIAAASLAPTAIRTARRLFDRRAGAAQGAPISPLLSNIHMHPFDVEVTRKGFWLARYSDDFVVLCRAESEALDALAACREALSSRRLRLNQTKTCVAPPSEPFRFLGYGFEPDGRVTAPPSLPASTRKALALALKRAAVRLDQ